MPFFWTRFFDQTLHYAGYASKFDDVHIEGDVSKADFIAYYLNNNKVVAAASMGRSPAIMVISEAMKNNLVK